MVTLHADVSFLELPIARRAEHKHDVINCLAKEILTTIVIGFYILS